MKVTVLLGSGRPGGLDVSLYGLARQEHQDFEVVFVDGRYHKRHELVLEQVKRHGIKQPFFHVPNHRDQPVWSTICAGFNTGFALADGEVCVFLLDYAYAHPGWLAAHVRRQEEKLRVVMSPHVYWSLPALREPTAPLRGGEPGATVEAILAQREKLASTGEYSIFEKEFEPGVFPSLERRPVDPKCGLPEGPCMSNQLHTKNESFPTRTILDINGMDEHYDKGRGPGDTELGWRLVVHAGLETWLAPDGWVDCLDPRPVMPNLNATIQEGEPPPPGRWSYEEGMAYYNATRDNPRASNPFELRELREKIWGWRELSQERGAVIPQNIVVDGEYWKP